MNPIAQLLDLPNVAEVLRILLDIFDDDKKMTPDDLEDIIFGFKNAATVCNLEAFDDDDGITIIERRFPGSNNRSAKHDVDEDADLYVHLQGGTIIHLPFDKKAALPARIARKGIDWVELEPRDRWKRFVVPQYTGWYIVLYEMQPSIYGDRDKLEIKPEETATVNAAKELMLSMRRESVSDDDVRSRFIEAGYAGDEEEAALLLRKAEILYDATEIRR